MSPTSNEYRIKQVLLITFTLVLYVRIVILYYEGLEINKEFAEAIEKAPKGKENDP